MITVHEIEQGTVEWHELRAGKYTGSNAHKLLGSFGAQEYAKSIEVAFRGNFHTKRGHILESEAIELYEQILKVHVDTPGFITNSKWPGAGYSPDAVAPEILIEVKCFDEKNHLELIRGNIPLKILAQVHFGLLITELSLAHLIAYNPALDDEKYTIKDQFKIIPIAANRNIQANFKRILKGDKVTA